MKSAFRTLAALCLLSVAISAQVVPVKSKIGLGSGNPASGKNYLHFDLWNCGDNFPIQVDTTGSVQTVVSRTFDIVANSQGIAQGQVAGNDQILCGNVPSTEWRVSVLSAQGVPIAGPKRYFICSSAASPTQQCSQIAGGGLFDVATAQIAVADPPAPGYLQIFGNPRINQFWTQPVGTTAFLSGTFDFTNANIIGLSGGGGGGGIGSVGGTAPIVVSAGSAPVVSIAKSDATHDGYVSSTDWNTFNSKGPGTVLSVGITVPQGLAVSGCPITGSGTCAISLNGQFPVSSLGTGAPNSLNWLNGSGAWTSPLTFGSLPVTSLIAGTNTSLTLNSNALTIASTSAVTYPIFAPDGVPPQHSFANHPEIGLNTSLSGSKIQITQVVVAGTFPTQTVTLTLSTPIQGSTLNWLAGDTFQLTALPASPTNLTSLNGQRYTVTTPSGANPFSTLAFTAPNTSIAAGTYAVTVGSASIYDLLLQGHSQMVSRLDTSTNVGAQHGLVRMARRDALCARTNSSADDGSDTCLIRGSQQFNAQNAVGAGYLRINGTPTAGASTISLAKGAGANWLAKDGDVIEIIHPNGDAEKQDYTIVGDTTVTQNTNTTVTITPVLATNLASGDLVVTSRIMAQAGDASGVEILGPLSLANTVLYPTGCLTVTSGIVSSTGTGCGGSASAAGSNKDIQFTSGSGVFAADTGVLTYDTATAKLSVGTLAIQGKSTVPNQVTYTNGAVTCAAPGAGKSAICIDTDGFFKVSENNGAYFRPGNGAGSGNVVIQGSPSAGQTAEWSDATHIAGIAGGTGTGGYVKATAPTITGPKLDVLNDVNNKASITLAATVNAVDGLTVTNAATANPATVTVTATGSDANINLNLVSKGTGVIQCNGLACGSGGSTFTNLFQTDANTLTQRNATVGQAYQVMASYTDAANLNGTEVGGNWIKTIKLGTGTSKALQFGVDTGLVFRGWQVATNFDLVPFNQATPPNVGIAANRVAISATSEDISGALTVTVTNDTVTGTTVNKLAKLTGNPSKAILTGTCDTDDFEGVVTGGAGIVGAATIARFGFVSLVFDAGTTAGDYVLPSCTVAGNGHDSGSTRPASGKVVGRVQSTNVSAGTYTVLMGLDAGGVGGGGSGTVSTVSVSGGAPLFSAVVNNPTTTPQLVFTPSNANANTIYANATGASAAPTFVTPSLTSSLFSNQGTTSTILTGNAAGPLTFGKVNLATMLDANNLPIANLCSGTGATASTVLFGDCTWRVPSGGGNVSISGSPVAGQAAEWATSSTIKGTQVSGSGLFLKQTSPIINNPSISSIKDGNGNPGLDFIAMLGAVDSLTITNATTGSPTVGVSVQGSDPNIGLMLSGKGTGAVSVAGPFTVTGGTMQHFGPEGADPAKCAGGIDGYYSSSTNHYLTMCNNNGAQQKIIGSSADISTSDQVVGLHLPAVRAGDLVVWNGLTWTTCAGNNSGSKFLIEDASGVCTWSAGTAAVAWSAFQAPVSDLNLSMTGFVSNFNYTSAVANAFAWINTTAATLTVPQSSPAIGLQGNVWVSAAGGSTAPDNWQIQNVVSAGVDATSTLTITHNRSGGLVSAPGYSTTTPTALSALEGSCAAVGVASRDVFCADSTLHGYKMVANNGTAVPVVGGPSGGSTNNNLAAFSGTGGNLLQDTGVAFGNLVTAASNGVNGELVQFAGANKTTSSSGIAANRVVTAAAVIASGNLAQGDGARGLSDTAIATNTVLTAAANFTTGHVISAAGNDKTTVDAGYLASNVITDTTNMTNHGVVIASGNKTIGSTAVGTTGIALIGQTGADPVFGTVAIAGGGTGATTAANAAIALLPVATRAGDVLYWDGSIWNHLAGNNSGTNFLQENSSGVPSWAAGSSTVALSSVVAAAGSNTINNGDNAQRWNSSLTTSGNVFFRLSENTAATAAGTPWLFQVDSIAASTANIAKFTALGTSNGVGVLKSGFLTSLGTGGTDSNMLFCDVTDATKCAQLTLSGITTATTRAVTIANGASTTVIADTGTANNFLTAISAAGAISKARPSVANLSDGANVVIASSPGLGIAHFAGSTQTLTSSLIVAADITSATITGTQIASGIALAGSPTTTTQTAKDNSTKIATTAYVDTPTATTSGTSVTLTSPRQYFDCTGTCTITAPVPAAGYEFCVQNNVGVSTVITFSAIGSSARYGKTDQSAYGTAGTGTLVSSGAIGDKMCLRGQDSTHYIVASFTGSWTAN